MNPNKIKIESSWEKVLCDDLESANFQSILTKLRKELDKGKTIYPSEELIFHAFDRTSFDKTKVVIIGQDPYHNPGQAMGLCFAVPKSMKRPPSLLNIYKEIHRDLGHKIPTHGDISPWADQGVLLLNAMLTVEEKKPGSHKKIGWQEFTNSVISKISSHKENVVFLLWGNFAKGKRKLIDEQKHLILESAHPSPLAGNAFQGNGHFSKTNIYLKENGLSPVDWQLDHTTSDQLKLEF